MALDFGGGLMVLVAFCYGVVGVGCILSRCYRCCVLLQLRLQSCGPVWMRLFIFRYDLEGFLEDIGDDLCIFFKPCIGY